MVVPSPRERCAAVVYTTSPRRQPQPIRNPQCAHAEIPRTCIRSYDQSGVFTASREAAGRESRARGDGSKLRSEEHTSELQSLMRISYAVFCLKKKNKKTDKIDIDKQES